MICRSDDISSDGSNPSSNLACSLQMPRAKRIFADPKYLSISRNKLKSTERNDRLIPIYM